MENAPDRDAGWEEGTENMYVYALFSNMSCTVQTTL